MGRASGWQLFAEQSDEFLASGPTQTWACCWDLKTKFASGENAARIEIKMGCAAWRSEPQPGDQSVQTHPQSWRILFGEAE